MKELKEEITEQRRKLNPKHKDGWRGVKITGFIILGLSVFFFIAMANSPHASGELIVYMVLGLICLAVGGLITIGGLMSDSRDFCHCAKCCSNPSKDGLYCNGHGSGTDDDRSGVYERHYHYDIHGHETGYTEVPKK